MLSKQVKQRIARNKRLRAVPKWKRRARSYFINELSKFTQPLLSLKHMPGGDVRSKEIMDEMQSLEKQMETITRVEWLQQEAVLRQRMKDFEGDTLNNLPPMELRNPVARVPKMRDPIGEYIHTYGHPPISISREMQAEIDQALADREKAMEELKKKGE